METTKKPRRRWSTVKREGDEITVAGRVFVEKTIAHLSDYQLDYIGEGADTHRFRVTISAEIGVPEPNAIVKAFAALGEKVAEDVQIAADRAA